MIKKIKCNEPFITKLESKYIKNVFTKNTFANDGYYSIKCVSLIQKQLKANLLLLTNSCTTAIEIALLSLDLKPKDEVIVPSYTFVSSVDVICKMNVKIIFCDIDEKFLINLKDLKKKITKNTKAIIITHYNGNSVDFEELKKIINKKNICIIEDAAQSYGAKYKNKHLGTVGDFGCFSFHQTKNLHCGTGGALLINNLKYKRKATIIWNRGTNRSDFFKGNVKKYVWLSKGSTAYLSEVQAAFLYAQLRYFKKVHNYRKFIFWKYIKGLIDIDHKIILPSFNSFNSSNYHLFYIVLPKKVSRSDFISFMKKHNIEVTSHYEALHLSPMIRNNLKIHVELPISEDLSQRIVRLPMHMNLNKIEVDIICKLTKKFILES
jgi:dTDP-4-amino-4,6-dideoxygalactose transaminase